MNCTVQFMSTAPARTPAELTVLSPLGTALAVAERLPQQAGAAFARPARDAFTTGLGPAMFTGAAIALVGVVSALLLAPRRIDSDESGDRS